MNPTPQPKMIRKSLSLILVGIGVFMLAVDLTLGASHRTLGSFHVPNGLPLAVIGAITYFRRHKEETARGDSPRA